MPILAIWLAGCATPAAQVAPAAEFRLPATGTIGVVSSIRFPVVDTSMLPYAPGSKAQGVAEAATGGAVTGALNCLHFIVPPAFVDCLIALASAGTLVGAAAGAEAAANSENVKSTTAAMQGPGQSFALQQQLRISILRQAATLPSPQFIDLGDGNEQTITGEPGTAYATQGVDAVLEVELAEITAGPTSKDRYGISVRGVSRLVRAAGGGIEALRDHLYVSPSYTLEEWRADGGRRLTETLDTAVDEIARGILGS